MSLSVLFYTLNLDFGLKAQKRPTSYGLQVISTIAFGKTLNMVKQQIYFPHVF